MAIIMCYSCKELFKRLRGTKQELCDRCLNESYNNCLGRYEEKTKTKPEVEDEKAK